MMLALAKMLVALAACAAAAWAADRQSRRAAPIPVKVRRR